MVPQWLQGLRGRVQPQAPLGAQTWFRCGGNAEFLFSPADSADLAQLLQQKPAAVPLTIIGAGSNLLVRDGGVSGVVVRLRGSFASIVINETVITVGAGALDSTVATTAAAAGLAGLEFLIGIPGTIGGGLRMNAGCYGREFKDVVRRATAMQPNGQIVTLTPTELGFTYRHCAVPDDWIFLSGELTTTRDNPAMIQERMDSISRERQESQPIPARTGGSTFANPVGARAWELIDAAGCRGLRRGGALVSPKHCNFLINDGTATASDLEQLGEEVRARVRATSGIDLRWEIRRLGNPV